jgi:heme O synthase-like polyprenyltransferase
MRFVLGFILGLVAGYCALLFGWVAYTNLINVRDFECAALMLLFAPIGGEGLIRSIL